MCLSLMRVMCPLICFVHPLPLSPTSPRMAPFDGSAWEEEDEEAPPPPDVPYYNNFPGKQPPPGGLIDMRTRPGATLVSSKRTVVENVGKVVKIGLECGKIISTV